MEKIDSSEVGIGCSNITETASDIVLQWGNRKRLRCLKTQEPNNNHHRTRRHNSNKHNVATGFSNHNNGTHLNLPQRILRNSEHTTSSMRGQSNGAALRRIASPDRGAHDKRNQHQHDNSTINNNNNNINSSSKKNEKVNNNSSNNNNGNGNESWGGTTSSGSGEGIVWPPKFVIALSNKEKEEDFYVFKGSKLPQRPKKRAKFIQKTLNHVSPGAWLCDLTLERYEVREKKISKKRPRGLKAMGNMESDSE